MNKWIRHTAPIGLFIIAGCSWMDKGGQSHEGKGAYSKFLGAYLGMNAWGDSMGNVAMYSASSGEFQKYISAQDFTNIFVLKTQPEYK